MHYSSIITILALPLLVISSPAIEVRTETTVPACYGGKVYNVAHKACECEPKKYWDDKKNKCSFPPMEEPRCDKDKKPYCSMSKTESCAYDKKNDYCEDNGSNSKFCEKPSDWPRKNPTYYPSNPVCKDTQKYCATKKKCECPKNQVYDDKKEKCSFPPLPKPDCDKGKKPW